MAFVESFERGNRTSVKLQPTKVVCRYSVSVGTGPKLIQLDTHGSNDRKMPGKLSQTLQIDAAGAQNLVEILRREFGLDR